MVMGLPERLRPILALPPPPPMLWATMPSAPAPRGHAPAAAGSGGGGTHALALAAAGVLAGWVRGLGGLGGGSDVDVAVARAVATCLHTLQAYVATAPGPSTIGVVAPEPASVNAPPDGVTMRTRWLFESTTANAPLSSAAISDGPLKSADVAATLSAKPAVLAELPESVAAVPSNATVRMSLPVFSTAYTSPPAPTATPRGVKSAAFVPTPSVLAA